MSCAPCADAASCAESAVALIPHFLHHGKAFGLGSFQRFKAKATYLMGIGHNCLTPQNRVTHDD